MRIALVTIFALMLSGCSLFGTKPLVVETKPVTRIPLAVPSVDPYKHRKVEWIIITPENAEKVFAELKKKGHPVVLFALTDKGYQALALNTGDQIKITRQMQAVIDAYKKYYVENEAALDAEDERRKKEANK